MKNLNRINLVGNLGEDPVMSYLPSGHPITSFSMAVNTSYKSSSDDPKVLTEWFTVKLMFEPAESAYEQLRKGNRVYVEGDLRTNTYNERTRNEIWTKEVFKSVQASKFQDIENGPEEKLEQEEKEETNVQQTSK